MPERTSPGEAPAIGALRRGLSAGGVIAWGLLAPILIGVACMVLHDLTGVAIFARIGQVAAGVAVGVVVVSALAAWRARSKAASTDPERS